MRVLAAGWRVHRGMVVGAVVLVTAVVAGCSVRAALERAWLEIDSSVWRE